MSVHVTVRCDWCQQGPQGPTASVPTTWFKGKYKDPEEPGKLKEFDFCSKEHQTKYEQSEEFVAAKALEAYTKDFYKFMNTQREKLGK